jgi:hypothetical protein
MRRWHAVGRTLKTLALAAGMWLAGGAAAWAAEGPAGGEEQPPSYVLAYMLVLLGIILGMVAVCHSSHRKDREGPQQYKARSAAAKSLQQEKHA